MNQNTDYSGKVKPFDNVAEHFQGRWENFFRVFCGRLDEESGLGLCPFCQERGYTLSFDRDAGRWNCPKCGSSGDPWQFYSRLVGCPIEDAEERIIGEYTGSRTGFSPQAPQGAGPGSGPGDWPEPVPLDDGPLPEMKPPSGILGEYSQAVARSTETPLELPLSMALATVATACQRKIIVQVKPGYAEPVNLYLNCALDSGNRKSSVHAEMVKPLLIWEAQKITEVGPVVKDLESVRRNQEARIKSLRVKYGKAPQDELASLEIEIGQLERDLAEVPPLPRVWVQDITPEQLGVLMAEQGEKIAILSAEGGIFDIVAGRYSNGVPNMDLLLQGHSGDSVRVDRGSRDPVYLKNPCITIGLSTQPEILRRIADVPGFRGRGFLARFLYLLPRSTLGTRSLETKAVSEELRAEYHKVIHALLNIEPSKGQDGEQVPLVLHLASAAYAEWLEFSRAVEVELREGGHYEHITDWAGKLPGAAIRLSGLLHCVKYPEQPWSREIDFETMGEALELAGIFSVHALRVFDLMGADKALQGARRVWRWIERSRSLVFTKRDVHQALRGSFPRVADIEPPLMVLEERSYLGSVNEATGGRPIVRYMVNPSLVRRWR